MTIIERIKALFGAVTGEKDLSQETNVNVCSVGKIQDGLPEKALEAATEGIVLLKNENNVLPLNKTQSVAIFGRVQNDYFCVGYGSGGDVNAPYKTSFMDALRKRQDICYDKALASVYEKWCQENAPSQGFWGLWPKCYPEMPLLNDVIAQARARSEIAVMLIGRAAGEDRENTLTEGSYYLTVEEKDVLEKLNKYFSNIVLVLDVSNIMDFSFIFEYKHISAVVYAPQGGMESGDAVVNVLWGDQTPSGKLTDTIAKNYEDYPSAKFFGGKDFNNYAEDIYVGYRYFETFAKDRVLFPFGFGLSYTDFSIKTKSAQKKADKIFIEVEVTNVGKREGKEVAQLYFQAPQGKLGKPTRQLIAFEKTPLLLKNESYIAKFSIDVSDLASYDDSGITGNKAAYVLEEGQYTFYVGNSARNCAEAFAFSVDKTTVIKSVTPISPIKQQHAFDIFVPKQEGDKLVVSTKPVACGDNTLRHRILENLPKEIPYLGDKGIKLIDVKNQKASIEDFVAQLSPKELDTLCRGDIVMHSSFGTAGNAGVFGGTILSLRQKGVPAVSLTDGPSGIRVSAKASLLPSGIALASSWNTKLVAELSTLLGKEMIIKGSHVILAPGMNIHRNPLCGRNFEYYSEDPLLSGKIASSYVRGAQSQGVSACPKHFACNNQETNRSQNDSRVSERALREIYIKGFEICVKEASPKNIMTSYNKINGVWAHYNYDLCTEVLRKEWGYCGNVMTDWWMRSSKNPDFSSNKDSGYRVRAQVDVLMPGSRFLNRIKADNTAYTSFKKKGLTLAELQRSAINVLSFIINSNVDFDFQL